MLLPPSSRHAPPATPPSPPPSPLPLPLAAGILSCLAVSPAMAGCVAAGSYDCSIGVYEDYGRLPVLLLKQAHTGGVTQASKGRQQAQ